MLKELKDRNYLLTGFFCIITYLIFLTFEYVITSGQMGVPLDDTWIHFQFADNFSKGMFFQFNAGEFTAGTTSPLYVIVLGTLSYIINNFIICSVFLSAAFHLLSCLLIYKFSLLIFNSDYSPLEVIKSDFLKPEFVSFIVALLTVFNGRFAWSGLSGMETTMFTFLCILGIYFHVTNLVGNRVNFLPVLFISLATISRPEGFLLFVLYLSDLTLNLLHDKKLKANIIKIIISVIIFLLFTTPYLIFSYKISGHFFPNTFRGQGGGFHTLPNIEYLRNVINYFMDDNLIIAVLFLMSSVIYIFHLSKYFSNLKYLNLIFLWIIILPLASSILIPNWRHHVRYMIPLIPLINLVSVYTLMSIVQNGKYLKLNNFILKRKLNLSLIIVFSIVYYIIFAVALGKNTDNINNQQVKLANWVKSNVNQAETIAVNDIGAIGFISKNKIIDMAGLITPEILRYRSYNWDDNLDSLNSLLKKNNVAYIIIYDDWFKEYMSKYGSSLNFVTSAYLEDNTICGGKEMKVYKTNF